jgi:AraC family transcriptional regulator of adaptative response/methylated-DNA-[protein]-cysteine methyltransferase
MTFLELARLERLRKGFEIYNDGGKVIDAQLEAGFSSSSAFRSSVHRLLGSALGTLSKTPLLCIHWIDTPLGPMIAVADTHKLHLLEFMDRKALPTEIRKLAAGAAIGAKSAIGFGKTPVHELLSSQLAAYFAGKSAQFTVPLSYHGSGFSGRVWDALRQIPAGHIISYGALAKDIDHPTATRAVARANGANQIAILIPCHRVIGAGGALTGYGGGLWRKQRLIEIEAAYAKSTRAGQP